METLLDNTKFAKRLQKIMESHELSATSFAEKLSVGRATISHLMAGRNKPSLDFVMKVVDTFPNIELEWLLYGKKTTPKPLPPTPQKTIIEPQENSQKNFPNSFQKTTKEESPKTAQKSIENIGNFSSSKSAIKRVIIFLEDGTFESYEM